MKHFLLLLLLIGGATGSARAQLVNLISGGIRMGLRDGSGKGLGTDPRAPTPDINVTVATYRGQSYPQKRTPATRLQGPGGEQIAQHEALLQQCQAALAADSTGSLGTADTWARLRTSAEAIARNRPTWNVQAYREEAAFYQAEDARRQRVAQPATR